MHIIDPELAPRETSGRIENIRFFSPSVQLGTLRRLLIRRLTTFLIRCIFFISSVLWLAFTMEDAIQKVLNSDKNCNETEKKACLNLTALS